MIRNDKQDEKYVWIDVVDLFRGASFATKQNNLEMNRKIFDCFDDNERQHKTFDKATAIKIEKNNGIVKYLKEEVNIADYETYIDQKVLKEALVRSYFEFNHQMKEKLSKYFRIFVENEINNVDNTYLKEEIKNDKQLIEYIKKYENFEDYVQNKIEEKIELEENIKIKSKK